MSNKLKILLTNDDGILSEGIKVLFEKMSEIADVCVLAPDSNRSAVSSHIVMENSVRIRKVSENVYSSSGYPADCVITALRSNLFDFVKFDAVLSGINRGANLGTDCIYSGTVAAARQAVLYGIPGIALSLKSDDEDFNYAPLAEFVRDNIETLISLYRPNVVLSVNALSAPKYENASLASLCIRNYEDEVYVSPDEDGNMSSFFKGGNIKTTGSEKNEYEIVSAGGIAISRFYAEPVGYFEEIKNPLKFVFKEN